jgi:hypothetical protein
MKRNFDDDIDEFEWTEVKPDEKCERVFDFINRRCTQLTLKRGISMLILALSDMGINIDFSEFMSNCTLKYMINTLFTRLSYNVAFLKLDEKALISKWEQKSNKTDDEHSETILDNELSRDVFYYEHSDEIMACLSFVCRHGIRIRATALNSREVYKFYNIGSITKFYYDKHRRVINISMRINHWGSDAEFRDYTFENYYLNSLYTSTKAINIPFFPDIFDFGKFKVWIPLRQIVVYLNKIEKPMNLFKIISITDKKLPKQIVALILWYWKKVSNIKMPVLFSSDKSYRVFKYETDLYY